MPGINEFASPGYPNKYPPSMDCVRVILAPPGYDIVLKFRNVFQIETSYEIADSNNPSRMPTNCPNDFLEIRDGRYSFSPLIGKFCGMSKPQVEIRATSGFMWLQFHSDALLEFEGFLGEFEYVRSSNGSLERQTECYFSYTMTLDGYINISTIQQFYESHRIPPANLDCVWRIQMPNWLNIAIFFEEFLLPSPNYCQENFVEIYSGHTSHIPIQKFCGVTSNHLYAGKNVIYVRVFASGKNVVEQMKLSILFSAYIAQKNCSEPSLFSCGDDICIPNSLVCNSRANCLYKKDEEQDCSQNTYTLTSIITSSYIPLPFIVSVVMIVVLVLFFWYKPYKKIPRERVVDFLRRLSTDIYQSSHSCRSRSGSQQSPHFTQINTAHINSLPYTRPSIPMSSSLTWSDVHHMYCPNNRYDIQLNDVKFEPSTSGANGSCLAGQEQQSKSRRKSNLKPSVYRTRKPKAWTVSSAIWRERRVEDDEHMIEMIDLSRTDAEMEMGYTEHIITSVTV
uniref:CUB domain-containing protein n=1 Tax=Acrobeloides nanus TaxID=290746 RepID=A0A914EBG2_9BILA